MLGLLGGLLTGIPGVVSSVLTFLMKRSDVDLAKLQTVTGADRDVMIATLQAQVAANASKVTFFQMKGVMIMLYMLYSPVILHAAIIALGRSHMIEWDVMDFLPWELEIVKSLYITIPSVTLAGGFTSWLHK